MSADITGQVILGRYRVDTFVEAGGMGAVYRIWDMARSVPLAMKVLHEELKEDPSVWKMFQREAEALKKLAHPHIVPFYGLFETPEFAFFLEHFVDGPSLKHVLLKRRGPLTLRESLIVLKAVAAALGYAHHNGIVHCDIKPGNVLLDQSGSVFLTDFGIARHALSTATTMASAGTPAYMAPEQIGGEAVTPSTDVYALGILLFEMLTGRRPFLGNEPESEDYGPSTDQRIFFAQMAITPPNPARINPEIPDPLGQVVLKAMEKEPTQRYANTAEMLQAACQAVGIDPESLPGHIGQAIPSLRGAPAAAPAQQTPRAALTPTGSAGPLTPGTPAARKEPLALQHPAAPEIPAQKVTELVQHIAPHPPEQAAQQPPAPQGRLSGGSRSGSRLPIYLATGGIIACLGLVALGALVAAIWKGYSTTVGGTEATRPAATQAAQVNTQPAALPTRTLTVDPAKSGAPTKVYPTPTSEPTGTSTPRAQDQPANTPTGEVQDFLAPLYRPLPGCAASHVHLKDWVMITFGSGRNSIRSTPDTHPSNNKIGAAEPGELIYVIDGPVCNYGWLLWKVRTATGIEGWTPETDGAHFWLEPFPSWDACPSSPRSLLHKEDKAQVTLYPPIANRVRSKPGLSGEKIASIDPGQKLTILDGPKCADGFVWWQVRAENGVTGWTAEGDRESYFLVPIPVPHY